MRLSVQLLLPQALVLFILLSHISVVYTAADAASFKPPEYWHNANIVRTLDLTSPIVRESIAILTKNVHTEPIGEYYFPIKAHLDEHLAWIEAKEKKTSRKFEVVKAEFDYQNQIQYYKVFFDRRFYPEEKITFVIQSIFTHILTPLPHEIPQTGRQYLLYRGNQYADLAYPSEKQKTNVKLEFHTLMSYTQKEGFVTRNGKTITYGPFSNTKPNSHEVLEIHYGYQKPILTVTKLMRELQVSHWGGNLAVEENYNLKHDGAKLKGHFSRLEYHQSSVLNHPDSVMARDLSLLLPPRAADVYYRDEIGNVSTSKFRNERDKSVLEFKPRYPLFGGWNYTWYYGYNVPLKDFLRYHPESGRYILNVQFISSFPQTTYDEMEIRIILPEGAKDVKVEIPFSVDKETHGKHKTNLDTTGHYLVVLEKHNVVDEHAQHFQISYAYDFDEFFRKPLAASTFFLAGFLVSMVYSRMEFKISAKPS